MKFKLRRYLLYYLGRFLAIIFYLIPLKVGLAIADLLGSLAFYAVVKYRRITIENLKSVFGGIKTDREIENIAKSVFKNLARNAAELINFPKLNKSNIDEFVVIRNRERLDKAFEGGCGVIVLTAHLGNWELVGVTLRLKDYPGVVIVKRIYFYKYDKFLNSMRKVHDVNVIYRDESPKKMLKVLKANHIVGILADQDVDSVQGVFVNFLGRQAYTPLGPVALARASGAKLVPVFIVREGGRHNLIVEEPVELTDTGNREADLICNTQKWSDVVESYIKKYPEQWVWMHRRWKTKANE